MVRRATEDSLSETPPCREVRVGSVPTLSTAPPWATSLISEADTIARVSTVSAGFEIWPLITARKVVVDYAPSRRCGYPYNTRYPKLSAQHQAIMERLVPTIGRKLRRRSSKCRR